MSILLALETILTRQVSYRSWHLPEEGGGKKKNRKDISLEVELAVEVEKELLEGVPLRANRHCVVSGHRHTFLGFGYPDMKRREKHR